MSEKNGILKPVSMHCNGKKDGVEYENEFISWKTDGKSGRLAGAYVKNASAQNLICKQVSSVLTFKEGIGTRQYQLAPTPLKETFEENAVCARYGFRDSDGKALKGVHCVHKMVFGDCGEVTFTVTLEVQKPLENVYAWTPLSFNISGDMNWLGIRDRHPYYYGYWGQNPTKWIQLTGGKGCNGTIPHLTGSLPLSLLFLHKGCEALQIELADNLADWDQWKDFQECAVIYSRKEKSYLVKYSPILAGTDITLKENVSTTFRMTLPFVRKQVVPLRRASNLLQFQRSFEEVCPTEKDFASWQKAGYSLLRWHNDSDRYGNGEFWRDAVYPPYGKTHLKRMDETIALAHSHGIKVVPYFSVKEIHPNAKGFEKNAQNWAKLGSRSRKMTISKFGAVMCLKTGWAQMRKDTIAQVLAKHDFDGIYYDWCGGIECDNTAHANAPHWDNDALLEHLRWTVDTFNKKQPERYLHTTHVISIAVENLATMVITEEVGFPEAAPDMFTPEVHFLNVAPRQICDMLPAEATSEQRLQIAMCALLNHATVSSTNPIYVDFYKKQKWMDKVTKYQKHTAPGEGIVTSSDSEVGFSLYYSADGKMMLVGANLSSEEKECTCHVQLPGKAPFDKSMKLKPLSMASLCFVK